MFLSDKVMNLFYHKLRDVATYRPSSRNFFIKKGFSSAEKPLPFHLYKFLPFDFLKMLASRFTDGANGFFSFRYLKNRAANFT